MLGFFPVLFYNNFYMVIAASLSADLILLLSLMRSLILVWSFVIIH